MKYKHYDGNEYDYNGRIWFDNSSNEYAHIYFDFYFEDSKGEKSWSHDLQHYKVSCQIDRDSIQTSNPCYVIRFEFTDSICTENFEEVCKILKFVNKGLEKYRADFGRIDSFGEFLTVVCHILKVKSIDHNNGIWQSSDLKWIVSNFLTQKKENWHYRL